MRPLVSLALMALAAFVGPANAQNAVQALEARLKTLAPNAIVLVVDEGGRPLVGQNAERPFVPASVAKIVTGWAALERFGPGYRFETPIFLAPDRTLHIKGQGDPFLVSEELEALAAGLLAKTGTAPFSGIVVDASRYPADLRLPGIEDSREAYDAPNAALAANFNTIHAVRDGTRVRSAEPQTPMTPLAAEIVRAVSPQGRARISLPLGRPEAGPLYAGELIAAFIEAKGGRVDGPVSLGSAPPEARPVYTHQQSRSMAEIVQAMLASSNNFIANQLFLEVGATATGAVSPDAAQTVLRSRLAEQGLADGLRLLEGSGISRDNLFTAPALADLLTAFAPYADLMRETAAGSRYKTGTFSGVSTLAGFARTARGDLPFVIALRGGGRLRFGLLEAIEKGL